MSRFSAWTASRLSGLRTLVRGWPGGDLTWRLLVILVGSVLVIGGLVLVPLPGPGWLIVFLGLSVLASEFPWADRLLRFTRRTVAAVTGWLAARTLWVRGAVAVSTFVLLAALLGAYLYWNGWWPFTSGQA